MEKRTDPLQKYLDDNDLNVHQFAKISKIPTVTLYSIAAGKRRPYRFTVLKLCKITKGKLKLEDYGYE